MTDKYRRVKLMSYFLLSTKDTNKDEKKQRERVVPYENRWFIVIVLIVSVVDLLRNCFFFYMPISLNDRFLYGDFIISMRSDHTLFNLVLVVCCMSSSVYSYHLIFGQQRVYYHKLSKFLYVLNEKEYSHRLLVSQRFAGQFFRTLDLGVLINQLVFGNYVIFELSFYSKTVYKAISLGFGYQQILLYTCPSILVALFAHIVFYRIAVQVYVFFILYIRLMNAKWNRLTAQLDQLNDRPGNRGKLAKHFGELDSVIGEYRMSREFFQTSLILPIPPLLITIILFPTNILFSENILTNHIVLMFFFNLFLVLMPIVKSNEKFKREIALYCNSVHRFMVRTRTTRLKLKSMQMLDISQANSPLNYTLLAGLFDLEADTIPTILAESFSLTFLIFPLYFYARS